MSAFHEIVRCPYCNLEQAIMIPAQKAGTKMIECDYDFDGCGISFVVSYKISIELTPRRIEGFGDALG